MTEGFLYLWAPAALEEVMSSTGSQAALDDVLGLLGDTVREWRGSGRRTTTAGITSALLASGAFDLEALGLASREEFWRAAETAGVITRERLPNGHWYLLLPGETVPDEIVSPRRTANSTGGRSAHQVEASATGGSGSASNLRRLRTDVWNAFVDWEGAYGRFWDRTHMRAFLIPAEWAPQERDAARFAEIEPASFAEQVGWMRDFARRQPADCRAALESSLADGAPRGAFRRELDARGMAARWREVHREHVARVVAAWAQSHEIEVGLLADSRSAAAGPGTAGPSSKARTGSAKSHNSGQDVNTVTADPGGAQSATEVVAGERRDGVAADDTSRLREQVHAVVDAMSFDELAGLPIRAAHLLRR